MCNDAEGDTILTSGFSSIFPEGIEVGNIESFSLEKGNFYDIRVKLSTDFQSLFHVNVIRNYRQEEQLNLEDQNQIMYIIARNIIRFLVVILFQVLVMDNVMINGYMIPYIYLLFILLMPFETPRWVQLLSGFRAWDWVLISLKIPLECIQLPPFWWLLSDPTCLNLLAPRDGYEPDTFPRIHYYGFHLVPEVYPDHCCDSPLRSLLPGGFPVERFFKYLAPGDPELNSVRLNHCTEPVFCIPKIDEPVY